MNKIDYIILGAHQKDLAFALSSWETLDLFDYERDKSNYIFRYSNTTRAIYIKQRGMYQFEFVSDLFVSTEEMIFLKFRLNIDGTPHPFEHQCNTETQQRFTQVLTLDAPTDVNDNLVEVEILIEVNAVPNDGAPTISSSGNEYLIITKLR